MRKRVAGNPATPADILLMLARIADVDSDDIEAIDDFNIHDEKVDEDDLEDSFPEIGPVHVRWYANQNPSNPLVEARNICTSERLTELAQHEDAEVRSLVAENTNTTHAILTVLATDSSEYVRSAVARNLRCPKNHFAKLCDDSLASVRIAAANNPHCTIEGLKVLATSEFPEYRELAAKHKNCSRDMFEKLARDRIASVRKAVVENTSCPIDIREPLLTNKKAQNKFIHVEDKAKEKYQIDTHSKYSRIHDDNTMLADKIPENRIVILIIRQWEDGPWLARAYKARVAVHAYLSASNTNLQFYSVDQLIRSTVDCAEVVANSLYDNGFPPLDSESGSVKMVIADNLMARLKKSLSNP